MNHPDWRALPALRLLLPFAAGILLFRQLPPELDLPIVWLAVPLLALLLALQRNSIFAYLLALLFLGATLGLFYGDLREVPRGADLPGFESRLVELEGPVDLDDWKRKSWGWQIDLKDVRIRQGAVVVADGVSALARVFDGGVARGEGWINLKGRLSAPPRRLLSSEFNYGGWLRDNGKDYLLDAVDGGGLYLELEPGRSLSSTVRHRVRSFSARYLDAEIAAFVPAILLGEKGDLDDARLAAYRRTGTAHVLALSGLHVGIVLALLMLLASWFRSPGIRTVAVLSGLLIYLGVVSSSPSIVRAVCMGAVFIATRGMGERGNSLNTLALAGLVVLVLDPVSLFSVGFQLSMGAVSAIVLLYDRIRRPLMAALPARLRSLVRTPVALLSVSVAAQIGTLPVTLSTFGVFGPLSALLNLAVVPLFSLAVTASVAGTLLLDIAPVARGMAGVVNLSLDLSDVLVTAASAENLFGTEIDVISPTSAWILAAGIVWLAIAPAPRSFLIRSLLVPLLVLATAQVEGVVAERESSRVSWWLVPFGPGRSLMEIDRAANIVTLWHAGIDSSTVGRARSLARGWSRRGGVEEVRVVSIPYRWTERAMRAVDVPGAYLVSRHPGSMLHPDRPLLLDASLSASSEAVDLLGMPVGRIAFAEPMNPRLPINLPE